MKGGFWFLTPCSSARISDLADRERHLGRRNVVETLDPIVNAAPVVVLSLCLMPQIWCLIAVYATID